jgi:hypothetical protein
MYGLIQLKKSKVYMILNIEINVYLQGRLIKRLNQGAFAAASPPSSNHLEYRSNHWFFFFCFPTLF